MKNHIINNENCSTILNQWTTEQEFAHSRASLILTLHTLTTRSRMCSRNHGKASEEHIPGNFQAATKLYVPLLTICAELICIIWP